MIKNISADFFISIWGFPKMVGFPNNHGVFLLKMISTWGCEMGVPYHHHLRKHRSHALGSHRPLVPSAGRQASSATQVYQTSRSGQ